MPGTMDSPSNRRTSRPKAKVKSGCRTCKIRKVKCDEGRPVCHRCLSTGRICDGYGIWGGGEDFYSRRQRLTGSKDNCVIPRSPASVSPVASGTEEKDNGFFEWFKCRTATKLPGSFISSFWTTLLLQASLNEPAVFHSVLALSSVHKRGSINSNGQIEAKNISTDQEQFALQHYVKAISDLQPHFVIKNRASSRVALITCVVFVCLEFLRGYFETAQIHLQNGLKILEDMQLLYNGNKGILFLKPHHASTDDRIIEAFSRLHLQVELFKQTYQHPCLVIQDSGPETPGLVFHSLNEAWQQLERLLNKIFHLTHQARQQAVSERQSLQQPPELLEHQQIIRTELAQWLDKYEAFKKTLPSDMSGDQKRAYPLLPLYQTMATIMVDTCFQPGNELTFDTCTDQFVLLIRQLADQWKISSATSPIQIVPKPLMDMARSIIDMGWIPPLYYVVVKCRIHRIRLQAIRLLECTSHREGIWDAKITACISRKVMEIEERDFYKDVDTADDFPITSYPHPQDLSLPTLPESYRIREVEVVLSGAPMDKILLFCKKKQESRDCRVLLSEYNVHLQRWIDERCG